MMDHELLGNSRTGRLLLQAALFSLMTCLGLPALADTYSAGTAITDVFISTPNASGKKWLTESLHDLECTTSTDSDCNETTCQTESDSVTHYWTATAGSFYGNDSVGTQVTYVAPSTYQVDEVELTAHANDDYAPESNEALYDEAEETSDSDPVTVVIIQIAELTESVTEDEYDEVAVSSSGEASISYSDASYGNLRKFEVVRSNVDYDYEIGTDILADLDEDTGEISMTLYYPGAYLVKTTRIGGNTIYDYLYCAAAGSDGKKKNTGKGRTITFPSQDLIVISSSQNDDTGYLAAARSSISGEVAIGSVANVITAINNKWNNNGNQTFTLGVIDHGRSALQSMGDGDQTVAGGFIDNLARSKADRDNFTAACKGKATAVTFYGCEVADGQAGRDFLQSLATDGNMSVTGYTGSVYVVYRVFGLWNHWEASDDGNSETKSPQ